MPGPVMLTQFGVRFVRAGFLRAAWPLLVPVALLGVAAFATFVAPMAAAQGLATSVTSIPSALFEPVPRSLENTPKLGRMADFGQELPSAAAQKLADWVMDSADNKQLPFAIVDKVNARIFVFDAQGQIRGASSILLGLAVGDHSVPGIGQRKLSSIRPEERTTPAGRFETFVDRDIHGQEVLWVDYDTAVSLHPVVKGTPRERRAERLASLSALDKRISYGCINVPVMFYEKVVSPTFTGTRGIVYVLPEIRSAHEVFGSYDVQGLLRKQTLIDVTQPSNSLAR